MTFLLVLLGLVVLIAAGLVAYTWHWKRKAERLVPPRGKFAHISTGKLHYVERGEGPDVLLIHGLGGQLGNFDCGVIDELAKSYHVIAIDRPGMGYSERPDGAPTSPTDQAHLMYEIIDALGLVQPLVVGHSLGGAISMAMAVLDQNRLRGLALLAPLTLPVGASAEAFNNLAISNDLLRHVISWTVATPGSIRSTETVLDQIYGPEAPPAEAAIQGGALLGLRPGHFYNTSRDYLGSGRGLRKMSARYADLTLPVRLLYGDQDRTLDYRLHGVDLVDRFPQFHLQVIEGAGHMLPVTRPMACAEFIRWADPLTSGAHAVS